MALTEAIEHTITIRHNGIIEWRKDRVIFDDTTEISRLPWRTTLEPGQDVTALPNKVKLLCNFVWTPAVVSAYAAWKAANSSTSPPL